MGTRNHFTVPEGYFDQFAQQIMSKLPEQKPKARTATIKRLRSWLYAAACLCVGVMVAAIAFSNKAEEDVSQQQKIAAVQQDDSYYSDNYIDEAADYAMIDNQEIYACLLADM